jgi:diguanylate cyclase (GGDEF)-like protein/PAS domain S-box-containing protein
MMNLAYSARRTEAQAFAANESLSLDMACKNETILIVEDVVCNLAMVASGLESSGFQVAVAQDADEALERAELTQPGLILLDVMLPGMDGFEVCRRLKSNPRTADIPVIFMTALSDARDKLRGFSAGGVDFITKPVQIDEVAARAAVHLRQRAVQRMLEDRNAHLAESRIRLDDAIDDRTSEAAVDGARNPQKQRACSQRKKLMQRQRELQRRLEHLAANLPGCLFTLHLTQDGRYVLPYASEGISGIFGSGLAGGKEIMTSVLALIHPDDEQRLLQSLGTSAKNRSFFNIDIRVLHPGKGESWIECRAMPEDAPDGGTTWHGLMLDITERKRMEERLHVVLQEFRQLVEHSPDTIARYDRDGRRVYANANLVRISSGVLDGILGTTPTDFPGGPSAADYQQAIRDVLERGEERNFELRWEKAGREICVDVRMTPEYDHDGHVTHVLAVGRDITEIDQYRRKIHRQAFFDVLTGLPNRALLFERIGHATAEGTAPNRRFGLMMLDLDHFKEVNDALGHGAGDSLLCEAAQRLQASVRASDTVARLGGDEFAVLLPDIRDFSNLTSIAGNLLRVLSEPFMIDGKEIFVSASIGITRYPDDSAEMDALIKYADSALYHAKKQGRHNFQFYERTLTANASKRLELEAALHKACRNGEFMLHYQPQIVLEDGSIAGAEALLRWRHPTLGMIAPDRFISIAEESGLIVEIGEWVLRTACATAAQWNRTRITPLKIAVNLSTRQFMRNDLVGTVRRILRETHCDPEWIDLEITESLLLDDSSDVAWMLTQLHDMGLHLAVDDFGTGYSALSYLNRFPVSLLKIDRSFVKDISDDRSKRELVKAILSISTVLHMDAVAEGVETREQAAYLKHAGCRFAQGYLFGKPMPLKAFEDLLEQEVRS